jgi:hypothetical protein
LITTVFLAGCAGNEVPRSLPQLHAVNAAGATVTATYAGPITRPVNMQGVGIYEAVPSDSDVAAATVTPQAAFGECRDPGSTCLGDPNTTGTVSLARVTSNTVTPDQLQNRLLYVIRWDGFRCSGHGPMAVTINSCTQLTFIDAQTGENLGATVSGTEAFDSSASAPPTPVADGKPSVPPPNS